MEIVSVCNSQGLDLFLILKTKSRQGKANSQKIAEFKIQSGGRGWGLRCLYCCGFFTSLKRMAEIFPGSIPSVVNASIYSTEA